MADFSLPNPLILTGTGFDAGEFFEGCQADDGTTPLGGANAHGFGIGENLLSWAFNRPSYGIMEDVEYLKDTLNTYIQKRAFVTCSAAAGVGADYEGPTALQDALAGEGDNCTIFLRNGVYTIHAAGNPAAPLDISQDDVHIIGEGEEAIVAVELQLNDLHDLTVSGVRVKIENVTIRALVGDGHEVLWTGDYGRFSNSTCTELALTVDGATQCVFEQLVVGGDARALHLINSVTYCLFSNIRCNYGLNSAVNPAIHIDSAHQCRFEMVRVLVFNAQIACNLDVDTSQLSFDTCTFTAGSSIGLALATSSGPDIHFDNCHFESDTGQAALMVGVARGYVFRNCAFTCLTSSVGAFSFVQLYFETDEDYGHSILENCRFDLAGVAIPAGPNVHLSGVSAWGLHVDYGTGGYDGTQAAIRLSSGTFKDVKVDFGDDPGVNMNNEMEAIQIGYGTACVVENLKVYSVFGAWGTTSVVGLEGSSSQGRAELYGLTIETSATTVLDRPFVKVQDDSLISGFTWDDQPVDAVPQDSLIGVGDDSTVTNVCIRDCWLNTHDYSTYFDAIIKFEAVAAAALTALKIRIQDCYISCVGAASVNTATAIRLTEGAGGNIGWVWIEGCQIRYGDVAGQGVGLEMVNDTAIMASTVQYLWISDTYVEGYTDPVVANAPGGNKLIYNAGGTINITQPTIIHQCVLKSQTATPASVGNGAATNDAAFLNITTNNILG